MQKNTSDPQNDMQSFPAAQGEGTDGVGVIEPAEGEDAAEAKESKKKKKKGGGPKRFFGAILGFFKKHKALGVLLIVLLVIVALVLRGCAAVSAAAKQASSYSFVRTTTLTKGDLTDTVSTTGTVKSSDTSTVTYASAGTAALPKFKTVNVAVGDTVQKGDVIATLDTSDIEESIAKEKQNIADKVATAQTSYNRALTSYNDAVSDYNTQKTEVANLLKMVQEARDAISKANTSTQTVDTSTQEISATTDKGLLEEALKDTTLSAALSKNNTPITVPTSSSSTDFATFNGFLNAIISNNANPSDLITAATAAQTALNNYQKSLAAYEQALSQQQAADAANQANSSNLATLQQNEQTADTKYESAKAQLDSMESQVTSAKNNLDDAKTNLDKASESDTLDDLNDQLADCSLKAETSGKITALNASVGSTPSGTIATIQDVDTLKVAITVSESDVNSIKEGMSCQITTDATDTTYTGTLTQIDPVAGDSNKFGAEVTVTNPDASLKIGMNATVKIVLSTTADCFTVPIDAVGTEGSTQFVYRKTGGEGTDMTFDKVTVTTGASNDYYIEISSDKLAEGDVIRSSADLTQGIVDTAASENYMENAEVSTDDGGQGGPDGGGQGGPNGGGDAPAAPAGGQ
ncbi:MAG: efflux RND transporter periplasmic adaptor subunit [Faecalibacterium sp.]|jgi:multidrug efflux pump subunit AcrA (membrane-fusion protein)|nr:efflux RND transporter periplasmic adaptor subunit [Faecalibacterium sp.]